MEIVDDLAAPVRTFPTLIAVTRHANTISYGAAVGVIAVLLWLGLRSGWVELYALAPVAGLMAYFAVRLAAEMVALVAETLMPR